MYYQNYEDYMRKILGYPIENESTYYYEDNVKENNKELEDYYPEIYKKINPIINEICLKYLGNISKATIDKMVEEVYNKIEIPQEYKNINIRRNNYESLRGRQNIILEKNYLKDLIKIVILNNILNSKNTPKKVYKQKDDINYNNYFKF